MYCMRCGKEVGDGANFCGSCGSPVPSDFPATDHSHEVREPSAAPVASTQTPTAPPSPEAASTSQATANQQVSAPKAQGPSGIRGWLIIVALGLISSVVISALSTIGVLDSFSDIKAFTDPAYPDYYAPSLYTYTLLSLLVEVALLVVSIHLLALMYRRKRSFPGRYFLLVWLLVVVTLLDTLYVVSLDSGSHSIAVTLGLIPEESYTALGQAFFGALVWGTYIRVSKRVKNTFVVD